MAYQNESSETILTHEDGGVNSPYERGCLSFCACVAVESAVVIGLYRQVYVFVCECENWRAPECSLC